MWGSTQDYYSGFSYVEKFSDSVVTFSAAFNKVIHTSNNACKFVIKQLYPNVMNQLYRYMFLMCHIISSIVHTGFIFNRSNARGAVAKTRGSETANNKAVQPR